MAIIIGRFERWFKQCDESILNCGSRSVHFWQRFVRQLGNGHRLNYVPAPRTTIEAVMRIHRITAAIVWLSIATLMAAAGSIAPALAADPLGTWYTADNDSQVRITNCGGALCGALISLKVPNDPTTG